MSAAPSVARGRAGWVVWLALGLGFVLVVVIGGRSLSGGRPYDPRSSRPDGTGALVDTLRNLGARVAITDEVPSLDGGRADPDTVVLVLVDRLDGDQRDSLLDWVDAGGRLVVTDVLSALHGGPALDGGSLPDGGSGPLSVGQCTIGALADLDPVVPGPFVRYALVPGAGRCFGNATNAFVRADARGAGIVVAVGGPEVFTNERLGQGANAALAMTLLAPGDGDRLVVLDGGPGAGDDAPTLLELVSPKVWQALAQLTLAFVVYALWRARRLGRPVADRQPVPVAGSDLVDAAGALLARGRHVAHAAATMRGELRRDARRALGDLSDEHLVAAIAARAGRPEGDVAGIVLGPAPTTEDELIVMSAAVEDLRSALGLRGPALATPDRRILR